jgi:hypothetical protein
VPIAYGFGKELKTSGRLVYRNTKSLSYYCEALHVGFLGPVQTPSIPEPLHKDKNGPPAEGSFNYASVINISKVIPDLTSAMLFPNAADLPILPNDLMKKLLNVLVAI